jgi:hypothetical protein
MPHDKAMQNIGRIGREVIGPLKGIWDDQWTDHWWPAPMQGARQPRPVASHVTGHVTGAA